MTPNAATFAHAPHTKARPRAATVPIEERISILEAHRESLTPALAMKADVRGAENRMILWILGAGLALAGFSFAVLTSTEGRMDKRIDKLDARIDKLDARLDGVDARIDKLDAKVDTRFDALSARQDKLDAKVDALAARTDARFDALDAKIDSRFEAVMAELRTLNRAQ